MKRYETAVPRLAIAVISLIVTGSTLGALVVLPSKLELASEAMAMLPVTNPATVKMPVDANATCLDVSPSGRPSPEPAAIARTSRPHPNQG